MQQHLKLAQIKQYPLKGDIDTNFAALRTHLQTLSPYKPDVVITPECFLDGYVVTENHITANNILKYALNPDSANEVQWVKAWAAQNNAWVILGLTRPGPDGAYNSAVIINRHGKQAGIYDKVHWQTHDRKFRPGATLPVFDSDFGAFGVMICADRRWPETVRTLALGGARIIFNPTYGMHDDRNLHMMQTRSYESEVYIAFTHPAQALVTDPKGNISHNDTDPNAPISLSDIDLNMVDIVRQGPSAHLRDRRPELYRC